MKVLERYEECRVQFYHYFSLYWLNAILFYHIKSLEEGNKAFKCLKNDCRAIGELEDVKNCLAKWVPKDRIEELDKIFPTSNKDDLDTTTEFIKTNKLPKTTGERTKLADKRTNQSPMKSPMKNNFGLKKAATKVVSGVSTSKDKKVLNSSLTMSGKKLNTSGSSGGKLNTSVLSKGSLNKENVVTKATTTTRARKTFVKK